MLHQNRQALVVEGDGMRGAFTSGVLDAFLQQQYTCLIFVCGVSSGSTMSPIIWQVNKVAHLNFILIILFVQNLSLWTLLQRR
jgi:predicted acylesterase/phospholipase RssA